MIYEIFGWIGLVLCVSAFFVKNVFYLRTLTLVGCQCLFVKYWHDNVVQGYVGNAIVICINGFYLFKMYRNRELHDVTKTFKKYLKDGRIKKVTVDTSD